MGVNCSGCKSQSIIEEVVGHRLKPTKKKNIREDCNCLMGTDIGAYNTCGHLCTYCYANENKAAENIKILIFSIFYQRRIKKKGRG